MNDIQHKEAIKEAVKKKFKGSTPLKSRVVPRYPDSAEREFKRLTNHFMAMVRDSIKKKLPKIVSAYNRSASKDERFDDINDVEKNLQNEIQAIAEELEQRIERFGVDKFVEQVADMTKRTSLREWKRTIKETLGVDLMDDYYNSAFYDQALQKWIDDNVLKIKSIPGDTLGEMRDIVMNGYRSGVPIRQIAKEIQEEYDVSRHKANMLARDQISSLNAQISRMQQEDAGCTKYRWSSSHDSRVRECHQSFDGKVFYWNDPPEAWYSTQKNGVVMTGRRCHPGEDYCCRCVAIPVFDIEGLDIPMKGE